MTERLPTYTILLVRLAVSRPLLRPEEDAGTIPARSELPKGFDALMERVRLDETRGSRAEGES